jgi:hypothetical protein
MAFTDSDIAQMQGAANGAATAEGLYKLGLMYSSGQGAPIDLIEAHKWFNLAALRGLDAAKAYRRECAEMMSKAEIAAAQKAAREWLNVAGDQPPPPVIAPIAPIAPVVAKVAAARDLSVKPAAKAPAKPVRQTQAERYARLRRIVGSPPVFAA